MQIFTWFICLLGIIGVILNIKKNKLCFIFWMITNMALMAVNFRIEQYAQALLFLIYLGTSIWGFIEWKRVENDAK